VPCSLHGKPDRRADSLLCFIVRHNAHREVSQRVRELGARNDQRFIAARRDRHARRVTDQRLTLKVEELFRTA
jgi:hypothetical protein